MNTIARLSLAAALAVPLAPAVAAPMQPGMWELSMTTDIEGKPTTAPVGRGCITQKDIDDDTKTLPRPDGSCKLSNVQRKDDRATYDLACTTESLLMRGRAEVAFAPERYDGNVSLLVTDKNKVGLQIAMTLSAKRVGECTR
jgi:hypothetical protein